MMKTSSSLTPKSEVLRPNLWDFHLKTISIATMAFSIFIALSTPMIQSRSVNSIYDISYMITNWFRISQGQIPYRDFILVHNPGSFLVGGLLFKFFGVSYIVVLSWMCFVNVCTLLLIEKTLNFFDLSKIQHAFVLLLSSFVLPYSVVTSPNYDADSTFAVLICVYLFVKLLRSQTTNTFAWVGFGTFSVIPFFVKQNFGGAYLVSVFLVLVLAGQFRNTIKVLLGTSLGIFSCLILFFVNGMLDSWWKYSIIFAARSRLGNPILPFESLLAHPQFNSICLSIFSIFFLYLRRLRKQGWEFTRGLAFVLLNLSSLVILIKNILTYIEQTSISSETVSRVASSGDLYYSSMHFIFWISWFLGLISLLISVKNFVLDGVGADELHLWAINVPFLACLYAALLSQGVEGSSYATGAMLVLLITSSLRIIAAHRLRIQRKVTKQKKFENFFGGASTNVVIVTFSLFLVFVYSATSLNGGRLGFLDLRGELNSNSEIAWIRTPGDFLPDQEYSQHILEKYSGQEKVVVFIPSAEFGYVLSETPPLADIHTFDTTTNPYLSDLEMFLNCNLVEVIVYNSRNQVSMYQNFSWKDWPPNLRNYKFEESVGPFDIFTVTNRESLKPGNFRCPSTSFSQRANRT